MQFNLKVKENCEKAIEGYMKAFGKLNVLVNNGKSEIHICCRSGDWQTCAAAMQEMCLDITKIGLAVTEKTFQTNVISMFAMSKYALKHMKRGDTVVNSTSVAA
jgi:NAD(P)-dependent dehydrogenase (short-subunit alcohol dehydrogenase family)